MTTTILEKIKIMADIEDQHDLKLNVVIEMMEAEVKNFCNLKTVPQQLENTIVEMVLEYLKSNPMGISQFEGKNVKSISRGDTTIQYATTTGNIAEIIEGYHQRLIPFRKLKMR